MIEGYTGREALAQGEAFDPSPDNVDARTITYELPNGMQVALLQKETRGDRATIRMRLHFGDEEALTGRGTAGGMAGANAHARGLKCGTDRRSRMNSIAFRLRAVWAADRCSRMVSSRRCTATWVEIIKVDG